MKRPENPFTMHRQHFWQKQAGNPSLTLWHRVYALAYGVHRRNGHAPYGHGELVEALTLVDTSTGEYVKPRPDNVTRAIRTAVEYGFLASGSNIRCLVVPSYAISGGVIGREDEGCTHH